MRRQLCAALLGLALPAAAVAQERTLRVVSPWEISALEPSRTGNVLSRMEIAETLTGADDGGLPVSGLAASWTVSDAGLAWRFALLAVLGSQAGQDGVLARNFSIVPDPIGTMRSDFGEGGGEGGAMGWSSPAMARRLAALSATTDPAARARLRCEVAAIFQAELAVLPIAGTAPGRVRPLWSNARSDGTSGVPSDRAQLLHPLVSWGTALRSG